MEGPMTIIPHEVDMAMEDVEQNTQYITNITNEVVSKYSSALDDIMKNIYTEVINPSIPAPVEMLEQYYMELANLLYFMFDKVETLGVYDDISKSGAKDAYNNAYMNSQTVVGTAKKPTVAESTAIAEKSSLYESVVNNMYNRSYRIFKSKIEAGYEMCRCLSKIISRRTQEMQMTPNDPPSTERQLLLEGELN